MQGLRLGTRGSALALAQARKVAAAIETSQRWPDGWVQIVEITTTGDKVQDRPLAEIGGKALWTKELDRALLDGEVDATLLASAGLKRLNIEAGTAIPTEIILPAPGQAVIGMECRTNDTDTQGVLSTVNNGITFNCVMAERAFTRALGATCHSPVAAFCVLEDGDFRIRAQLFSEDGSEMVEQRAMFDCDELHKCEELARSMLAAAPESVRRLFEA